MWWRERSALPVIIKRNVVSCCCGAGTEGFPECPPRRWHCSIFLAVSSLLQSKEIIDLKVSFEKYHNAIED